MKKVLAIFIGAVILIGLVYYLNNLSRPEIAKAGASDNVSGWAWAGGGEIGGSATATIGWISFNCTDREAATGKTCLDANDPTFNPDVNLVDYGVKIDPSTGLFSGYAWAGGTDSSASGTIGWISFSTSSLVGCPSGACEARLDLTPGGTYCGAQYKVCGWARALSATSSPGGWDGWIKLNGTTTDGTPYGVSLKPVTKEFEGWAAGWDDSTSTAVIGWISFNCKDGGLNGENICATSPYKVATSLVLGPTVSNPTSTFPNPCLQSRIPTLSWTTNAEGSYDYQIQIASSPSFASPIVNAAGTNSSNWAPPCNHCCKISPYDNISFGESTYYWRVRVHDTNGTSSWATSTFITKAHCYPYADFSVSPSNGTVGQVITFEDNSTCYGASCSYSWNFGDGSPIDNTIGTTTHAYTKTGTYKATLNITDDVGSCTSSPKTIHIRAKLPWWREILPK